jgi:hypothetical protein
VHKHYWPLPKKDDCKSTDPPPTDSPTDDPPDIFETQVLIPFIGNPYDLSEQEKHVLEQAFLDTYTTLNDCKDITITSFRFIDDPNDIDSSNSQC